MLLSLGRAEGPGPGVLAARRPPAPLGIRLRHVQVLHIPRNVLFKSMVKEHAGIDLRKVLQKHRVSVVTITPLHVNKQIIDSWPTRRGGGRVVYSARLGPTASSMPGAALQAPTEKEARIRRVSTFPPKTTPGGDSNNITIYITSDITPTSATSGGRTWLGTCGPFARERMRSSPRPPSRRRRRRRHRGPP